MKDFIENNPAIVIVMMAVFGIFTYIGLGVNINVMMGVAEVTSKQLFLTVFLAVLGAAFIILPVTFLYDIINIKNRDLMYLRRLNRNTGDQTAQAPRARTGESEHWQTNVDDDDDLDGDGNGNDALRRLGAIQ